MEQHTDLLAEVLRMKAAYRLVAKAKSWPEKAAAVERMRTASRLAKEGMRKTRQALRTP